MSLSCHIFISSHFTLPIYCVMLWPEFTPVLRKDKISVENYLLLIPVIILLWCCCLINIILSECRQWSSGAVATGPMSRDKLWVGVLATLAPLTLSLQSPVDTWYTCLITPTTDNNEYLSNISWMWSIEIFMMPKVNSNGARQTLSTKDCEDYSWSSLLQSNWSN